MSPTRSWPILRRGRASPIWVRRHLPAPRRNSQSFSRKTPRSGAGSSARRTSSRNDPVERSRALARFGEQRELPRLALLAGLIGQPGRIFAGEAMVGELRPARIAGVVAHRLVDALDR